MKKNRTAWPFKTIPVDQAVGTAVAHDMTQVIPGKFKGPAFKKGHEITSGDLCRLMQMGKNNLYVLDLHYGTAGLRPVPPDHHFRPDFAPGDGR